jgi:hypothetical protein
MVVYVSDKVAPLHAIKVYWGVEVQLHLHLILALEEFSVSRFWYPLHRRLSGPQSRYRYFREEKSLLFYRRSDQDYLVVQPVA